MPALAFNLDAGNTAISNATVSLIKLMLPAPGQEPPTVEQGQQFMTQITEALTAGASACAEIKRLREAFAELREQHRPQPHPNPSHGAICVACSLHGAVIPWPCGPWNAAETALTHGQS